MVLKSTVPVGTNAAVAARLQELTGRDCDVASNPEFLKEGAAIDDFMKPDRVVIGARREEVFDVLWDLYQPYLRTDKPLLAMSPESAEMTKYVANALLSTKISFINEMANLCERTGADINEVRRGIGHDSRIGFAFLFPGVGYGGSCFPKDVRGAGGAWPGSTASSRGSSTPSTRSTSARRPCWSEKIDRHFGGQLAGTTIAVWGLAFKPGTDDIREAPPLVLIDRLLAHGGDAAGLRPGGDGERPPALRRAADLLPSPRRRPRAGPTPWRSSPSGSSSCTPTSTQMRRLMRQPVIFDGRNLYDPRADAARPASPTTASAARRKGPEAAARRLRQRRRAAPAPPVFRLCGTGFASVSAG